MDIDACFPSAFISASDLQGHRVPVTISHLTMEEVGAEKEQKPVLYFAGKQKGLVLNRINANTIKDMLGPETERWRGHKIVLTPDETDFAGRRVACVRVAKGLADQAPPPPPPDAHEQPAPSTDPELPGSPQRPPQGGYSDDEVPF